MIMPADKGYGVAINSRLEQYKQAHINYINVSQLDLTDDSPHSLGFHNPPNDHWERGPPPISLEIILGTVRAPRRNLKNSRKQERSSEELACNPPWKNTGLNYYHLLRNLQMGIYSTGGCVCVLKQYTADRFMKIKVTLIRLFTFEAVFNSKPPQNLPINVELQSFKLTFNTFIKRQFCQ